MKVGDLKLLEPMADCFDLEPGGRYLVTLPPPLTPERARKLREALRRANVQAIVLEGSVTLTELGGAVETSDADPDRA